MGSLALKPFQRAEFNVTLTERPESRASINSLPELLSFNAQKNGENVFCAQAETQQGLIRSFDLTEVTFLELALSVENCCAWIQEKTQGAHRTKVNADGQVVKSGPIALLMESDLTLFIYIAALLTLNIPCILISTRLNSQAIKHLMKISNCHTLVASKRTRATLAELEIDENVRVIDASKYKDLLTRKSWDGRLDFLEDCRSAVREDDSNVIILHSSGTTGQPKLISLTHRYVLGYAGCHEFASTMDMSQRGFNVSTLPLFHGFGLLAPCLALSTGLPVLFPPGDTIPNGTLLIDLIKSGRGQVSSAMTVPTILEDITTLPEFINAASCLSELDFIAVGGGGIKHTVGAKLHSHNVTLVNHFGATELGALAPIFLPGSSYDWRYLRLRRDMGLKLDRIESESASSLVRTLTGFPFGWGKSFELQDRLEVNPMYPDSEVAILGRNDDLIVLATGEKVLPFQIERSLEAHPMIKRAVAFGNGQFEIGVLVEPFRYEWNSKSEFVDIVWAELIKANELGDQHAQVAKQSIIIKPEQKDIPLTDKGSVRRKEVDTIFQLEIEAVYSRLSMSDAESSSTVFDVADPGRSVEELVHACLPSHIAPESMKADTDFILTGMDSLQITRLRRRIESSLINAGQRRDIPRDIIYSYPNIAGLTAALTGWLRGSISESTPIEDMITTANRYVFNEPQIISQPSEVVVLMTGTTGNLGANLVQQLALHSGIGKVVCMIRQPSVPVGLSEQEALIEKQKAAFDERGIVLPAEGWLKIEMLSWTAGAEFLGLSGADFHALARRVTHIFHGAWPMDFKLSLNSLEPHIKALQDLVELGRLAHCFKPTRKCRLVLASSIAVVGRCQQTRVPEAIMQDPHAALPFGYARAKWVCEEVMKSVYEHIAGISPVVLRIGQMSGATATGFWSHKEHFPALIKCSQIIGGLPALNGTASWIPVDRAAAVSMDVLLNPELPSLVYHLENPVRQSWPDLCTVLEHELGLKRESRMPFKTWLDKYMKTEEVSEDLIDFFQNWFLKMSGGALVLDTQETCRVSHSLRSTGDVNHSIVRRYVQSWRSTKFIR